MLLLCSDNSSRPFNIRMIVAATSLLWRFTVGDVVMADEVDVRKLQKKEMKSWSADERKAWKEQYGKEPRLKELRPEKGYKPGKLEKVELKQFRRQQKQEFAEGARRKGRSFDAVNRTPYAPAQPFRQVEGERLTVDLPAAYSALDLDTDGQIGLYEWIKVRRSELDLFDQIDSDGDGLLTPTELSRFDKSKDDAGQDAVDLSLRYQRPRLQVIGGTWNLTARSGRAPTRDELPTAYNPGAGRTREERGKLHQDYVDKRMASLSPRQKARIKELWDEKQKNDPNMANRGASFVRIMEYVAENEK